MLAPVTASIRQHRGLVCTVMAMWLLWLAMLTPAIAQQDIPHHDIEQQKINYLIASVEGLKDVSFIRNGSSYNAEQAASHMRLKLRMAGSRVKTADDFIVYCATESSVTGIKYTIRFPDGHTIESATFLRDKLASFKASD
ncbi:DUF5329 family protein [Dyella sp. GSA-30]|uniref:DUF5329 family protein n=1 Tax=Dyella sp. GSA-30 TaxID=2994496 RepID=UPI0024915FC4|nr:DUF5329 family protein [Dyella sp. GSA-30]BDU19389.1 hypothetical protein DYGSA30_08460 [Dyella sp. GSA-30]